MLLPEYDDDKGRSYKGARMKPIGLRERKKIRRREEIVLSAMKLFAENGYDETTIAHIAETADVAPRTVLTYFATKEDIAMAPVVDIADRLLSAVRQRMPGESTLDVFATWLREEILIPDESPTNLDLLRQMFERNPKLNVLQSASIAPAVEEVSGTLAREMGRSQDDDAPGLVVAAMMGIMTYIFSGPVCGDRASVVDVALRFLQAGMDALRFRPDSDD
jgi:AcrR family transcriptional regulator